MKIYLIKHKTYGYDIHESHVIVAKSEEIVRLLAKNVSADEGKAIWDSAEVTIEGEYTGNISHSFILHSSFRAG